MEERRLKCGVHWGKGEYRDVSEMNIYSQEEEMIGK